MINIELNAQDAVRLLNLLKSRSTAWEDVIEELEGSLDFCALCHKPQASTVGEMPCYDELCEGHSKAEWAAFEAS